MRLLTLLGLLVTSLAPPAHATDLHTPAVYASFDIGSSSVSSKIYEQEHGDLSTGFAVGYAFNPHFAVEAFSRGMSFRLLDGLVGDTNYYPDTHVGVAAVGALQLSDRFRLLGRIGIGRTKMKAASLTQRDFKETDASLGIGLSYDFSPGWSVQLSNTRFMDTKVTTTLLGLSYRF